MLNLDTGKKRKWWQGVLLLLLLTTLLLVSIYIDPPENHIKRNFPEEYDAIIALANENHEAAEQIFRENISEGSNIIPNYIGLIGLLKDEGRYEEASEYVDTMLNIKNWERWPSSVISLFIYVKYYNQEYAQVLALKHALPPDDDLKEPIISILLNLYTEKNRLDELIEISNRYIAQFKNPNPEQVERYLSGIYNAKKYDQFIGASDKYNDRLTTSSRKLLVTVLLIQKKYQGVFDEVQKLPIRSENLDIPIDYTREDLNLALGDKYYADLRFEWAKKHYEQALINPTHPYIVSALVRLTSILLEEGEYEQVESYYAQAMELINRLPLASENKEIKHSHTRMYNHIAWANELHNRQRFDWAKVHYRAVIDFEGFEEYRYTGFLRLMEYAENEEDYEQSATLLIEAASTLSMKHFSGLLLNGDPSLIEAENFAEMWSVAESYFIDQIASVEEPDALRLLRIRILEVFSYYWLHAKEEKRENIVHLIEASRVKLKLNKTDLYLGSVYNFRKSKQPELVRNVIDLLSDQIPPLEGENPYPDSEVLAFCRWLDEDHSDSDHVLLGFNQMLDELLREHQSENLP